MNNSNFQYNNNFNPQQFNNGFQPKQNFEDFNYISGGNNNSNMYGMQNTNEENTIIQSLKYVSEKYPHLITLNQQNIGMKFKVRNHFASRFFVIKSFTEEDIHKVFGDY